MTFAAGENKAKPKCDKGLDCTTKEISTIYRFNTDRFLKSFNTLWINLMISVGKHKIEHAGTVADRVYAELKLHDK